jgi:hypothetical protein
MTVTAAWASARLSAFSEEVCMALTLSPRGRYVFTAIALGALLGFYPYLRYTLQIGSHR